MITAENDPLRDEGETYARKLTDAGVPVAIVQYNGTIHDFVALNALRKVPTTEAALDQIAVCPRSGTIKISGGRPSRSRTDSKPNHASPPPA